MRLSLLFALAYLALTLTPPGTAYARTSPAGAEMLRLVEQRARHDARAERERATIQDLSALYGDRAKAEGVTLEQVVDAYESAYESARPPRSFFREYSPHLGWLTAVVLFVLTLFRDTLRDVLGPRLKALGDKLYDRLAGYSFFRWKALGNYRKLLITFHKRFRIPFMADRHLDMDQVYVPLKVEGAGDFDQIVDFGEVARYKRLVVTGQPGSGKSMLLRRLALLYATEGLRKLPDQPTPVLFELHRLNADGRDIFEHLVDVFRLHKFPGADAFIRRSLARGKLMLLLDGLDEVDSDKRAAEVKRIKDFILENDACRVMLTCRTAVYRGEFDDIADRRLDIVDFSDQQIRSFLEAWPDMPANKSVGQLLAALDERPLIRALAGRPLLLTIIAFLYTAVEDFRLPHSRADFYKMAADVLLGGLKGELNKYEAPEKQLVLEHLALFNQTKKAKDDDDRLTLDRQTVLAEMRKLLPEMGRKAEDAPAMLEEIVARSSLMLPLDNKSRYVFSHLTLQEYFAASALRTSHEKLLAHFAADRDAWRETAKLWCGLAQDSTEFIDALYKLDPVAALECLADAKRVSPERADAVINSFMPRLGQGGSAGDAVNRAFAAAATGNSPRSRRVFEFLVRSLGDVPPRRAAAAAALSLTNNPEAAPLLAKALREVPEAEAALVRMGDLAVPALETYTEIAKQGVAMTQAMRALASIRTPKAIEAMVRLLWHPSGISRVYAAHALGIQLQFPQVEASVRSFRLPPEYAQAEWHRWVWSPFEEGESPMTVVAGRVGFLIESQSVGVRFEDHPLDPRIIIPLVVHKFQEAWQPSEMLEYVLNTYALNSPSFQLLRARYVFHDPASIQAIMEVIGQERMENPAREIMERKPARAIPANEIPAGLTPDWERIMDRLRGLLGMLSLLDTPRQVRLFYRLVGDNPPTLNHWRKILRPAEFSFGGSLHHRAITLILFALPVFSGAGFYYSLSSPFIWESFRFPFSLAALAIVGRALLDTLLKTENWAISQTHVRELLFILFHAVGERRHPRLATGDRDMVFSLVTGLYLPLNVYLGSQLFVHWLTARWIVALWALLLGSLYALYWLGKRKERQAANPLVGLL